MSGVVTGLRDAAGALFTGEVEVGAGLQLSQNATGKTVLDRPGSGNYVFTDSVWAGGGKAIPGYDNAPVWAAINAAIPPNDVIFVPVDPDGGEYEISAFTDLITPITVRSTLTFGAYGAWFNHTGAGTGLKLRSQGWQLDGIGFRSDTDAVLIDAWDTVGQPGNVPGTLCALGEMLNVNLHGSSSRLFLCNSFFINLVNLTLQGKTGGSGWFIEWTQANACRINGLRCSWAPGNTSGILDVSGAGSQFNDIYADGMPSGVVGVHVHDNTFGFLFTNYRNESNGGRSMIVDANAFNVTIAEGIHAGADSVPVAGSMFEINGGDCTVRNISFANCTTGVEVTAGARRTTLSNLGKIGSAVTNLYTDASGEGCTVIHSAGYPGIGIDVRQAPARFAPASTIYPSIILRPSPSNSAPVAPEIGWMWMQGGSDEESDGFYYMGGATGYGAGLHGPLRGGINSHGVFKGIELMGAPNQLHMRSGLTNASAAVEFFRDLTDQYAQSGYIGFPSALAVEDWLSMVNNIGPLFFGTLGVVHWKMDVDGHFLPTPHAAIDIGNNIQRVRDLFLARTLNLPASDGTFSPLVFGAGTAPTAPANGSVWYESATGFWQRHAGATSQFGGVPDADASTKGKVQLAGDLAGTAAAPLVAARAITVAKMQAIATNLVLGRYSGSTGDIEGITVSTGLSVSGGNLAVTGALPGTWDGVHLVLDIGHLWRRANGQLMWNASNPPGFDADGVAIA